MARPWERRGWARSGSARAGARSTAPEPSWERLSYPPIRRLRSPRWRAPPEGRSARWPANAEQACGGESSSSGRVLSGEQGYLRRLIRAAASLGSPRAGELPAWVKAQPEFGIRQVVSESGDRRQARVEDRWAHRGETSRAGTRAPAGGPAAAGRPRPRIPSCIRVGQSRYQPPLPGQPGATSRRCDSGDALGPRARSAAALADWPGAPGHDRRIVWHCESPDPTPRREHLERHPRWRPRADGEMTSPVRSRNETMSRRSRLPRWEPAEAPAFLRPASGSRLDARGHRRAPLKAIESRPCSTPARASRGEEPSLSGSVDRGATRRGESCRARGPSASAWPEQGRATRPRASEPVQRPAVPMRRCRGSRRRCEPTERRARLRTTATTCLRR